MYELFSADIGLLDGVGEKTKGLFKKIGVPNIGALLYYFPRDYEDWNNILKISQAGFEKKDVCIKVTILSNVKTMKLGIKKTLYKTLASDGDENIDVVFFNNKYVVEKLKQGDEVLLYGKVQKNFNKYEIICPKICLKGKQPLYLKPIYGQIKGLHSWKIESIVESGFKYVKGHIRESLPERIISQNKLCSLEFALKNIHFPKNNESLKLARRRLIFEEIFIWQMGMKFLKKGICVKTDVKIQKDYTDEFYFSLPFFPTNAQKRAISECVGDMTNIENRCMNRLLQGDVGSGKTVVAGAIAYNVIKNGYQVAIMVPTEILANQHFETFKKFFYGMPITVEILTGALKSKEQKEIREKAKEGEINLLVGTHSLISENLEFKNLGLVVTDEQHRFGVRQRGKLVSKGNNPHVLVMSATPIPRSLSLIIYGDMDISILDERPAGRQPVDTFVIDSSKKERMYGFIRGILDDKKQGYIVCPCVEESEIESLSDVTKYKEDLINKYGFSKYRLEVLHGKMKSQEKERIMNDFLQGKIDLLISTTAIEVGVDVPNACIIVIENAERFGLSQLHQLRGRVGRGKDKSYCVLVSDSKTKDSISRFKVMASSNDGFYLSNEDLKIRGPGEFLGSKQHGNINFKLVNIISDISVIKEISEIVEGTFKSWDDIDLKERNIIEKSVKIFLNNSSDGNIII